MEKDQHIDLISTWQTSNRITEFLLENLPDDLWNKSIPGIPQLNASLEHSGKLHVGIPWSNIPPDAVHFAVYMIAHEAHQIDNDNSADANGDT